MQGKTRTVHLKDVPVLLISADDKQRIETKADIVRDDRSGGDLVQPLPSTLLCVQVHRFGVIRHW